MQQPVHRAPGRILVTDDEDILRRAIARALGSVGHTVTQAANGREAMALLSTQKFDVILSDVRMPDMDGTELLRFVRERDLDIPVILMTGAPDVATAMRAMEFGAMQYLAKPLDMAHLCKIVEQAVSLNGLARAKREALALMGDGGGQIGDRAGLETSFDRAMATFWMAYQPIVRFADRSIFGHEALVRSREPALPHPGALIEAAERLGRLHEMGRALRAATLPALEQAPDDCLLFVNLHTRDLLDDSLASPDAPLSKFAHRVVLEITERRSLDEVRDCARRIARLRELGFRVAVDDLGAGYAGLTSFAQLEPEIVKLDMSLVRGVDQSPTKQKLIRSMTTLCHDMGMLVVAEGVETIAERDAVCALQCDLLQGYLFAKPAPPFPTVTW